MSKVVESKRGDFTVPASTVPRVLLASPFPPNGAPAVAEVALDQREEPDDANGALTVPKAMGLLLIATQILWLSQQMLT